MKNIAIWGSTGSIGCQALRVIENLSSKIKVTELAARSNVSILKTQIRKFKPCTVSVWDEQSASELRRWLSENKIKTSVLSGINGLCAIARNGHSNLVLSAVVGSVGLKPLVEAIRAKKDVALANKEALVIAGNIVMVEAQRSKVDIIPVDSEHSAIFQCIKNEDSKKIRRIILTASGGPFYRSRKRHSSISVQEALAHPTWSMGPKITIDSATLMNKGLEAIEAHHLFNLSLEKIDIVIHPQSIVHSMVEFVDGSVIAQMSNPDMRLPIQYALTYPERCDCEVRRLDLTKLRKLEFYQPDFRRFPCLKLALKAGKTGGTMPAAMNAANETAVESFLNGEIRFDSIPMVIEKVMSRHKVDSDVNLEKILLVDSNVREEAREIIAREIVYQKSNIKYQK